MSVVSAPLKNDIAARKDIFRLSAVLFSETHDVFSTSDAQLQMVKCMFAKLDNRPMSKSEIIAGLLDVYKYHVSEDEIIELIRKAKKTFQAIIEDNMESFRLTDDVYKQTLELQEKGIDFYIDQFIDIKKIEDGEKCKLLDERNYQTAGYLSGYQCYLPRFGNQRRITKKSNSRILEEMQTG